MFARQTFRCAQPLKQVSTKMFDDIFVVQFNRCQSFRKYSAEAPKAAEGAAPPPPPPKKGGLTPIYLGVGLAGLGAGLYRYYGGDGKAAIDPKDRPKVFNGESWVDLKLAGIETLSHNTKRLRFEFDDKEAVSGLQVACQYLSLTNPSSPR